MAEVLARVVQADLECARGPDVSHRIRVPRTWLEQGAVIELELPRHLTCRACDGGGCDVCERSGAVTLRDRGELPDLVEVTLPARAENDTFVIRIPERGGLPAKQSGLPRGQLFLKIEPAEGSAPSASVGRVVPVVAAPRRTLRQPLGAPGGRRFLWPAVAALVVVSLVVAWLLLRAR